MQYRFKIELSIRGHVPEAEESTAEDVPKETATLISNIASRNIKTLSIPAI